MLSFIRRHPVMGLLLALSLEAWLAVPGEAMIAVAAAAVVHRVCNLGRIALGGMAGMLANDMILFGISRAGRGVLANWIGLHTWHFHLSAEMLAGAKFLPPLRSAACIIYGLQGATFSRFLAVSLLSNAVWIGCYMLLGRSFHSGIGRLLGRWEQGGRWATALEIGLTVAAIAAVWL